MNGTEAYVAWTLDKAKGCVDEALASPVGMKEMDIERLRQVRSEITKVIENIRGR